MAYVSRTPIEKVSEALGDLTFSDMMIVAECLRDQILGYTTIIEDQPSLDIVGVAHVLSDFADARNQEYQSRAGKDA